VNAAVDIRAVSTEIPDLVVQLVVVKCIRRAFNLGNHVVALLIGLVILVVLNIVGTVDPELDLHDLTTAKKQDIFNFFVPLRSLQVKEQLNVVAYEVDLHILKVDKVEIRVFHWLYMLGKDFECVGRGQN
jgi:hypothetical protein